MDENGSICTGRTSCASFGIIICLLFIAIFSNYILRCIHSSRPSPPPPSLPLFTTATVAATASHRHALKSIPETTYEPKSCSDRSNNFESENCAVCLAEFEEREKVRVLPKCKHVYHRECIDKWLIRSLHCPVCRERVVDPHDNILHAKLISTATVHNNQREESINHRDFSPAYLLF